LPAAVLSTNTSNWT